MFELRMLSDCLDNGELSRTVPAWMRRVRRIQDRDGAEQEIYITGIPMLFVYGAPSSHRLMPWKTVLRSDRAGRHPGPAVLDEPDLRLLGSRVFSTSPTERTCDVDYG
jgi:hypothetical protein